MALATSSPPALVPNSIEISMSDSLDDDIAQVRAEIQALTQQRKLLTSSLLASTKVQSRLSSNATNPTSQVQDEITSPLNLTNLEEHSQSNVHRLAIGVTSFPFTDPSPQLQSKNPLLGVRFDICNRKGQYDSPYYMFCIRVNDIGQEVRIHRHTLPALVPLEQYERDYLPLPSPTREDDEGYVGSDGAETSGDEPKKQNLHALVGRVRYDLVSWRLRQDVAGWLKEELGLSESSEKEKTAKKVGTTTISNGGGQDEEDPSDPDTDMPDEDPDEDETSGKFDIDSLEPLEVDARQLRIIWSDDRVGRLKIADSGKIEKAVVIGDDGNRIRDVERVLTGDEKDGVSMEQLLERLELIYVKTKEKEATEVSPEKSHEMARLTKGMTRPKA